MPSILCTAEHWFQFASGVFAVIAAVIWFLASRVRGPSELTQQHLPSVQGDSFPILDRLMKDVARQSRRNATAAFFAALAAFCQLPQAFMPTCWSGAPWFLSNWDTTALVIG
jgi:hypothetical protein